MKLFVFAIVAAIQCYYGVSAWSATPSGLAGAFQSQIYNVSIDETLTSINVQQTSSDFKTYESNIQSATQEITSQSFAQVSSTISTTISLNNLVDTINAEYLQIISNVESWSTILPSCLGVIDVSTRDVQVALVSLVQSVTVVSSQVSIAQSTVSNTITTATYNLAYALNNYINNVVSIFDNQKVTTVSIQENIAVLESVIVTVVQTSYYVAFASNYVLNSFNISSISYLVNIITYLQTAISSYSSNSIFSSIVSTSNTLASSLEQNIISNESIQTVVNNQVTLSSNIASEISSASTNLNTNVNSFSSNSAISSSFKSVQSAITLLNQQSSTLASSLTSVTAILPNNLHSYHVNVYNIAASIHLFTEKLQQIVTSISSGVDQSSNYIAELQVIMSYVSSVLSSAYFTISHTMIRYMISQASLASLSQVQTFEHNFSTLHTLCHSIVENLLSVVVSSLTILQYSLTAVSVVVQTSFSSFYQSLQSLITSFNAITSFTPTTSNTSSPPLSLPEPSLPVPSIPLLPTLPTLPQTSSYYNNYNQFVQAYMFSAVLPYSCVNAIYLSDYIVQHQLE